MFRNYFIVNIILILMVSFLGLRFYKAITYKKDNPVNIKVKKAEPGIIKAAGEVKVIDKESLKVITEKDIFRSSRTAPSSGASGAEIPPKNPPTLFGTIIVGTEKTALLKEDAGKAAKMYRVNESVSGYRIVDIQDDKVLIEAGGQTIEVKLRGKKGSNTSQLTTPGVPVQKTQEGVTRRRVRPTPQRPTRNEPNVKTPVPSQPPVPVSPAPIPVPAPVPTPVPEPVPNPEPAEGMQESPDGIQQ